MRRTAKSVVAQRPEAGQNPHHEVADDRRSSWTKIKNPQYSQVEGREELFERMNV